jgi:hypothetical protein
MDVGKSQEENIKVLMEYKVFDINNRKMNYFFSTIFVQEPLKDPK